MRRFPLSTGALIAALLPAGVCAKAPTLQAAIGAPDDFTLSGSVRLRYETIAGAPRPIYRSDDEELALRTTLAAEYHAHGIRIGAEVYDSRITLDRPGSPVTTSEVNALELVQAYVGADLGQALGRGTKAQVMVGRMMLNLGSRRLVAADDYRNTTNSYTGVRADMTLADGTTGTFIYTLPQYRLPDDAPALRRGKVQMDRESLHLRLWGGLIAHPRTLAGATAELNFFRLQERDSPALPTRNRDLTTVGARLIRDPKPALWDFELEGIYQTGSIRASLAPSAARQAVSAWFVHADAGYSFPGAAKLRLSAEFDYASGDGRGGRYGRFDTLFGMRRADLAPAGIFNGLLRSNIMTPGIRVEAAPGKRLDMFAAYRGLWLADRFDAFSGTGVRDPNGRSGRFAGQQLEGRVRYWLVPGFLRGEIDALWLARGRFLKTAPGARDKDAKYLAVAATATF
ncbi:alginate export family protein [uncultured Novosphingobium sp.]|uniref:alginate export family protein n=1 Tax=uncultured Novosphingobium sp. TaxID=292277 RepID=UPI00258B5F35|nr:alginate export family protein [uncultured Novosphingobium sp.]